MEPIKPSQMLEFICNMKHLFGSKNLCNNSTKIRNHLRKHKMMEGESHSMNCERNQPHLLKDGAFTGLSDLCSSRIG